jgi:hypothetical protein
MAAKPKNPGMIFTLSFFLLSIAHILVYGIGNMYFPTHIVVGTHSLTYFWALALSGGVLALLSLLVMPFFTAWEMKKRKELSPLEWMVGYFVVDLAGVWAFTRFSEVFGLGVSSWVVVLALAIVLDIVQGVVMMQLEKIRKNI